MSDWLTRYRRGVRAHDMGWAYFAKAAFGAGRASPDLCSRYLKFSGRLRRLASPNNQGRGSK